MVELPAGKLAYNLDEAAAAIGLGKTSVRELITAGSLVAFRLKGRVLIRRERLAELLEREEAGQQLPPPR